MENPLHIVSPPELEGLLKRVEASAPSPAGLFGPDSISWKVNRESALFLAAGRAALLQLAHPWVAAAIAQHSRTLEDPVGRFHRTFRVMFCIAFGTVEQALTAARQLHRRHGSIRGQMPETVGPFTAGSAYEANELGALRWVYATLVDSSVRAYELALPPLTEVEREQYYIESRVSAALFGISGEALPPTWNQFVEYVEAMYSSGILAASPATRALAQQLQAGAGFWLRTPSWYRALTAHLLPPQLREEFGLPYGKKERRSAIRASQWLPGIYRRLPAALRFVGPYQEAQARLRGAPWLPLMVRLNNRLWIGGPSLGPQEE